MSLVHTIGRVGIALLGFVFMAVSTADSTFQAAQLCAKMADTGKCADEIESSCYYDEEWIADAVWVRS